MMMMMMNLSLGEEAEDGAQLEDILDKKRFLRELDEDDKELVKKIIKTQLFRHFIEDAFEYDDDNYEIKVFTDCVKILDGMGDVAEEYIREKLTPSSWNLLETTVPLPTDEGLPSTYSIERR